MLEQIAFLTATRLAGRVPVRSVAVLCFGEGKSALSIRESKFLADISTDTPPLAISCGAWKKHFALNLGFLRFGHKVVFAGH